MKQNDMKSIDVFISFKASDDRGFPTEDRFISQKIFEAFEQRRISTYLGSNQEDPLFEHQLSTCKVLVVVATTIEMTESLEKVWSVFLNRGKGNHKRLFILTRQRDDFPSLLYRSSIDLNLYPTGGYESDLVDKIVDVLGLECDEDSLNTIIYSISQQGKGDPQKISQHLKLGDHFRLEKNFDEARTSYEQALSINPECSDAWWGLLCCFYGIFDEEDLPRDFTEDIRTSEHYRNALRFASLKDKERYRSIAKSLDEITRKNRAQLEEKQERKRKEQALLESLHNYEEHAETKAYQLLTRRANVRSFFGLIFILSSVISVYLTHGFDPVVAVFVGTVELFIFSLLFKDVIYFNHKLAPMLPFIGFISTFGTLVGSYLNYRSLPHQAPKNTYNSFLLITLILFMAFVLILYFLSQFKKENSKVNINLLTSSLYMNLGYLTTVALANFTLFTLKVSMDVVELLVFVLPGLLYVLLIRLKTIHREFDPLFLDDSIAKKKKIILSKNKSYLETKNLLGLQ